MGFEGKGKDLKEDIISAAQGNEEARKRLSAAGKKGAETRAKNLAIKEVLKAHEDDFEWNKLYTSRLDELKEAYPELDEEGEPLPEGWHEEEAARTADAILKMRNMQKEMERKRKGNIPGAVSSGSKNTLSPREDLEKQKENGNSFAKKALDILGDK
jgi:hypothetical protein